MTYRNKQATHPDPLGAALTAWHANAGTERDRMEAAIDAYEEASAACTQCDEPGCEREATCGWPVADGYRRTCGEHWVRPEM